MTDVPNMKRLLKAVYPNSTSWATKVDKMKPNQVTAIFLDFKSKNYIKE